MAINVSLPVVHISIRIVRGPVSCELARRPIDGNNASSSTAVSDSHANKFPDRLPPSITAV